MPGLIVVNTTFFLEPMQLHRHSETTYQHYKISAYHSRILNHGQWKTYPTTITCKGTFARGTSILKTFVMGIRLLYHRDIDFKNEEVFGWQASP